jgi:hypothetical protein
VLKDRSIDLAVESVICQIIKDKLDTPLNNELVKGLAVARPFHFPSVTFDKPIIIYILTVVAGTNSSFSIMDTEVSVDEQGVEEKDQDPAILVDIKTLYWEFDDEYEAVDGSMEVKLFGEELKHRLKGHTFFFRQEVDYDDKVRTIYSIRFDR